MAQLTSKRLILSKIEASYGTDSTPSGAFNAVQVFDLDVAPLQSDVVDRDLNLVYYGASEQLLANPHVEVTLSVELTGSGVAGVAPRFSSLLRACSLQETVVATPVTGTAVSGGLNTLTLQSGASSVDEFYVGRIMRVTGGTGLGTLGLIIDYVGASRVAELRPFEGGVTYDATSLYSIDAGVVYTPTSDSPESTTIYYNVDGTLHRITGCRGTCIIAADLNAIPAMQFTFNGVYNPPTDTALPAVSYADQAAPRIFKAGNSGAYSLMQFAGCLRSVTVDLGNELVFRSLVNCVDEVVVVDRVVSGDVIAEATPLSGAGGKDYFATAILAVTAPTSVLLTEDSFDLLYEDDAGIYLDPADTSKGDLSFVHGTVAGNVVAFLSSRIDLVAPAYQGNEGVEELTIPFVAVPSTVGDDELTLVFS
jgi:hypothetical protein